MALAKTINFEPPWPPRYSGIGHRWSRCVAAGHACAYSKRKWHLPRPGQDQRRDGDGIHL